MPTLKMYIGNILLDKAELDYSKCETVVERILEQKRIAAYLWWLHYQEVGWRIKNLPEFFVDEESKMNDRNFEVSEEAVTEELLYEYET